ncbi:MAG: C1 family peptidase [Aerococcus sp.]|nr:C1 family peptidase [Aerococcus sp.]
MIDQQLLQQFKTQYQKNDTRAAGHAVAEIGINAASVDLDVKRRHTFMFSDETPNGVITNQKQSGRCWMFATLNSSRVQTMKKLNVASFDFSKTYTLFFDKLEKSNTFLENIIATADRPTSDRTVTFLLESGLDDGGYWEFATGILKKYGNVPAEIMPETANSENTTVVNRVLSNFLRQFAVELRQLVADGADEATINQRKDEQLYFVYTVLVKAFGEVPETFDYSYRDKDDRFHRISNITPQAFFNDYVGVDLDEMVDLINAPMMGRHYGENYSFHYLASVHEADPLKMVNVPIEVMKEAAIASIKDGRALWFTCDVTTMSHRQLGILDPDIYNYEETLGASVKLDKGQRLEYRMSTNNHAMTLVGVDLDEEGKPLTWKVENSWGEKNGKKGIFSMSDSFFDEYVYELAVPKQYLSEEVIEQSKKKPILLDVWDPLM